MAEKQQHDTQADLYYLSDGAYANFVTGLGNPRMDKDEHTHVVCGITTPNYEALAAQFVKDGVVKQIARGPSVKALKTPIVINNDKDDKTFKALSRLGFFRACRNAGTWARLFGGALVVTLFEGDGDGKLEEEPGKLRTMPNSNSNPMQINAKIFSNVPFFRNQCGCQIVRIANSGNQISKSAATATFS